MACGLVFVETLWGENGARRNNGWQPHAEVSAPFVRVYGVLMYPVAMRIYLLVCAPLATKE